MIPSTIISPIHWHLCVPLVTCLIVSVAFCLKRGIICFLCKWIFITWSPAEASSSWSDKLTGSYRIIFHFNVICFKSTVPPVSKTIRNKRHPQDIFCRMVYYPTVFRASTSSPARDAIRGWAILNLQIVACARWTTVPHIYVFNDQHNAFSFTCSNFPTTTPTRRITPWIVRTNKNSWCLIQSCHTGTHCRQYKWTEHKCWRPLEL